MARKGLLLINLGTPDAPTPEKVRAYLKQFLMDPFVIDIPFVFRWLLVHGAILPKRPALSALAYQKVWTEQGSPLLHFHLAMAAQVQKELDIQGPGKWLVAAGMRYGQPSIEKALDFMHSQGVTDISVFPLYPQYSLAATESSVVEAKRVGQEVFPSLRLKFLPAFYDRPAFIEAFASRARESLQGFDYDHLLFSFHGLPERQVKKTDPTAGHCLKSENCCEVMSGANRDCYRAQSYATARALARSMGLAPGKFTVSFQSRLGRTPWIKPYTDVLYGSLPKKGVKKLAVMCPAFVADCLETLEEIQIRGREEFIAQGGEDLRLVPSLNDSAPWVHAVVEIVRSACAQGSAE